MTEEHDAWMAGLGVDIGKLRQTFPPPTTARSNVQSSSAPDSSSTAPVHLSVQPHTGSARATDTPPYDADQLRILMRGAPLKTKQQKVSVPVINRYIERALRGETPPNIKITDTHVIIEGNHRYIAGYVTKRLPGTDPYPDSKPKAPSYDFGDLVYDDADWGGE